MGYAKVRDFTGGRTSPNVDVALHGAADLLIALWLLDPALDEPATDTVSYDIGTEWFEELRAGLSPATNDLLDRLGSGDIWIGCLAILAEESDNGTVDSFIEFLSGYDPVELRYRVLLVHSPDSDEERELAANAAEGNLDALAETLALQRFEDSPQRYRDSLQALFTLEPTETRALLVDVLSAVQTDVFSKYEAEFRPALERDVAARRSMARRMSPERFVEITTNGISVEGSGFTRPITLMPSIVGRPWVIFTESPKLMAMSYPVADEYLDADPDAPPQWLIKTYKALGDERRLRILRRLARGSASLADLTEEMSGSKSTIHHHLVLLRAAGLVKVTLGGDKEYSLRADALPETTAVLQGYIDHRTDDRTTGP